jgi:iron complex outermembrane receptor protein/outer membrane receptor for ferrienterochelin and colicins
MFAKNKTACFRGTFTTILLASSMGIILNGTTFAATSEEKPVFGLGEVVVSAERDVKEGPTTITQITAEDMERQNATNLGEALKLIPGILFRQARSINEYYVTIRGFEQENVLILLDGVPINVPYEGLLNLADIPVQNIAEIKVIKGLASTLYGPNAMGGVINIITKTGTAIPKLSATYQVSEYNTHHFQASHGWKIGKFSYFLGGSHRESDGYPLASTFAYPANVIASMAASPANPANNKNAPIVPDSGKRENSDYNRDSVNFTGSYDFNADNRLGLSVEYYDSSYGVPPGPFYREHNKGFFYFPRYRRYDDWRRYTFNLIEESKVADTLRLKFRLYYDDYKNVLDTFDNATYTTMSRIGPASGRSTYDDFSTGGNLYAFWTGIANNELRFGFSFKKDYHTETFVTPTTDALSSNTYSISLEDEYRITKALTTTLGASFDMFNKTLREQASAPGQGPGRDVTSFNPQVGVTYEFTPELSSYASVGRKIRFPTMRNLYSTGIVGPKGNPDLKEESSINYEVGTKWKVTDTILLESAFFYNDITDLINFDNQTGRFEQYHDAYMTGIETNLSSQLTRTLFGRIGYTFLTARNRSPVTIQNDTHAALVYTPSDLPYRPAHKLDFELRQDFSFGTKINLNGSFVSERTYYNHADTSNINDLVAKKETLDSYFLLNIKASQDITKHAEIFMSVENLFNENYQDLFQFAGKGRTVWAGVKLSL